MKQKRINDVIKSALFNLCENYYTYDPVVKNLNLDDDHTYTWFLDHLESNDMSFVDSYIDDDDITHDVMELDGMEYNIYTRDGDIIAKKGKFTWVVKSQEFEMIKDQFVIEEKESRDKRKAMYGLAEYGIEY